MYETFLKVAVIGILTISLFGASAPDVFAQAAEGLQVSPAIIEDKVNPGQEYRFFVKVTNISNNERTFFLLAQDITSVDERGVPTFSEVANVTQYELSTWVKLPQASITLNPGQSTNVPFTVLVPTDAAPGAHFGGVFFEIRPDQRQTTGAAVGSRVGVILSLKIAGDITEEMRLREFSTEKFIYNAPPIAFTTKVDNLGNVLIRPHGLIEITDMFGKQVGSVEVNASASAIFPGTNREYDVSWEGSGFSFGRYQALLSFVYGEEGRKTVVRTTSFWVLPLKPTLIIFGSIGAAVVAFYLLIQMYIRRKMREMGLSARSDAGLYARKYRPLSRTTFVVFGLLLCCLVFLVLLFLLFA